MQKHHHVHKPKPAAIIKNLKPQNALKASKTIVLAKKNKFQGSLRKSKYLQNFEPEGNTNTNTNKSVNVAETTEEHRDSDEDSIGSASDLRDVDEISDAETMSESEIESLDIPSVYTCGSSVYHAECESMTASNTFETRRRKRVVRETTIKSEEEDHVAHREKPLLEEFDSDTSPQFWDSTWDNDTKDVFAMAPFQRPDAESRKKKKSKSDDLVTFSPEKLKLDLLTFSESDSQHEEKAIKRNCKSPNLIILSESETDLKKPQESEETQILLTDEPQDVNSHLIKDVTVTERLHLVREKLKPLEKLDESEPFTPIKSCSVEIVENQAFYKENPKSSLFSGDGDRDRNFSTNVHGFFAKMFPEEKASAEYSENRDIFGFTPFNVLPANSNPFEGDDFKPTINEICDSQKYFPEEEGEKFVSDYDLRPPSPCFDNKTSSTPKNYEHDFIKSGNEKESKVHFSLSDKILNFKSEKMVYYDSLEKNEDEEKLRKKLVEKLRKKLEEKKNAKTKSCDKTGEKHNKKYNKNDSKMERGFSNMSFEDCLSGEDNHVEDRCSIDVKMRKVKPVHRQSNPFT